MHAAHMEQVVAKCLAMCSCGTIQVQRHTLLTGQLAALASAYCRTYSCGISARLPKGGRLVRLACGKT